MKKNECFKIRIDEIDREKDIFDLSQGKLIKKIMCGFMGVSHIPKTIMADPFLFVFEDTLFLFYEDKSYGKDAVISMSSTKDLTHWTKSCVVLKETCHLSYPFVFEDDGDIYMIPETCALNEIRLYKANKTLTEFSYYSTLITDRIKRENFSFSDTSVKKLNSTYYLMTTICDSQNELKLFYSDNLIGPYKEHSQSPVVQSNKYGRNAGSLFEYGNKLYRVAQDCETGYGENIHLFEVVNISRENYLESLIRENLLDRNQDFYKFGGHQFNYTNFLGKNIVATDAKEYRIFFCMKIINKIKKAWSKE